MGRLRCARADGEDGGGHAADVRADHLQERGVRESRAQRRAPRQDHYRTPPDLAPQVRPEASQHLIVAYIDRRATGNQATSHLYVG